MTNGEMLSEILEVAVAQGQAPGTVAEMTRDQLTDGGYTWAGGLGTTWVDVPDQDLTAVVLTQRAAGETGLPAVGDEVLAAVRVTA